MRGRNREFQYLPAKIVGKITKCRYLPSKIASFEIQKKIDSKYDLGKCHFSPDSEIQKKFDSKYDLQKCHFRPNPEIQKKIDSKYKLDPILGGVWKFHFLYFFPASVPNRTLEPIFRPSPGTGLGPGRGLAALWHAAPRLAGSRLSCHLLAASLPGACNPLGLEAQRGFVISMRVLPSLTPPAARAISGLGRSIAVRNCL
jgi:hypothetical protein